MTSVSTLEITAAWDESHHSKQSNLEKWKLEQVWFKCSKQTCKKSMIRKKFISKNVHIENVGKWRTKF